MIWIIGTLIGFFILGAVLACVGRNQDSGAALINFSLIGLVVMFVFTMVSVFKHADDIGTIKSQHLLVKEYQSSLDELSAQLKDISVEGSVLSLNHDTPYASLVAAKADMVNLMTVAKVDKAAAIRSVEKRRAGPFEYVISMMGDYEKGSD